MKLWLRVLLGVLLLSLPLTALALDKGVALKSKPTAETASTGRRLALVVGNSAYRFSGGLANPARDAELMAGALKGVGFELVGGGAQTDLSYAALNQAIETFGDALRPGDVALFYYSGHGLQVAGENYLVPIDADIKKEAEVKVKTVPVNLLFAKLEGIENAVNLVVLDACRNNPFARSFRSSGGGLAQMNAPTGTLVAFSTAPGQVAEDGSGQNSAYTAALAKYVSEPGIPVEEVFKKVRSEVSGATRGAQTPWENTSLTGNFRFVEGDALALKKAALAAAGDAKKGELDALLKLEEEAKRQKEKEQAEIVKREAEVSRMDAEIAAMKQRLGTGTSSGNDSLKSMVAMVGQREAQAKQLEELRKQREAEDLKRQQEIARLKVEAQEKLLIAFEADIVDYTTVVNSPYGKDMADAAWQSLLQRYPQAAGLEQGQVVALHEVVVEGVTMAELREREQQWLRTLIGDMVQVPGGCFQMGDTFFDGVGDDDEKPVHEVCVDAFAIGKYEVTHGQWQKLMGSNLSGKQGDNYPVAYVSWEDAQVFIRKLNQQTGKGFRLPTEAEWEYSARSGGKQEMYAGGDNADTVAWIFENAVLSTHPVGKKQPNGLGLFDMSGNVWEWVQDYYDDKYYAASPRNNPQGPGGSSRVFRGGSWNDDPNRVRSAHRGRYPPGHRTYNLGFRLAFPARSAAEARR